MEYNEGEGSISLRFSELILPYVAALRNNFTIYSVRYVLPLTSWHAVRLFELLWERMEDRWEVRLETLKDLLGCGKTHARLDVFKRALTHAVQQINDNTPLEIILGQRKNGREVIAIQFQISKKAAPPLPPIKALGWQKWFNKYQTTEYGENTYKAKQRTFPEYRKYKKNPGRWDDACQKKQAKEQATKEIKAHQEIPGQDKPPLVATDPLAQLTKIQAGLKNPGSAT